MVLKTGKKRLAEMVDDVQSVLTAEGILRRQAKTHMDLLRDAVGDACICGGRAVDAWARA